MSATVENPTHSHHDHDTKPVHNQVVWFDIPVTNLDRAIQFYSAVLGDTVKNRKCPE